MPHLESRPFKDAAYAHLAEVGKAFSSPTRLEILELLVQAPRTVEAVAGLVGQSVANTSHHLQTLKRARLVSSERDGLHIVYSVVAEEVGVLMSLLQQLAMRHVAELQELTAQFFADRDGLESIDRETLIARLGADDIVLLDVRPEHEFASRHLPGAVSMPLGTLEARLAGLPLDRPIVAY